MNREGIIKTIINETILKRKVISHKQHELKIKVKFQTTNQIKHNQMMLDGFLFLLIDEILHSVQKVVHCYI